MNRSSYGGCALPVAVGLVCIPFSIIIWYESNKFIKKCFGDSILQDSSTVRTSRKDHDHRRHLTYPQPISNTWYHICDSEEVKINAVLEVRALGQVFVVWRKSDGTVVCQNAFCLHLGANLAVGGKVINDCLQCPFHQWKFNSSGDVTDIPYINEPQKCPSKQLKTYTCRDYCGLICVYFHADDGDPPFDMPDFVSSEFEDGGWAPHLKW